MRQFIMTSQPKGTLLFLNGVNLLSKHQMKSQAMISGIIACDSNLKISNLQMYYKSMILFQTLPKLGIYAITNALSVRY